MSIKELDNLDEELDGIGNASLDEIYPSDPDDEDHLPDDDDISFNERWYPGE